MLNVVATALISSNSNGLKLHYKTALLLNTPSPSPWSLTSWPLPYLLFVSYVVMNRKMRLHFDFVEIMNSEIT